MHPAVSPIARTKNDADSGLAWFWPVYMFEDMVKDELHQFAEVLKFAEEAHRIDYELKPVWATPNTVTLDNRTMLLRDFSAANATGIPVLVDAPFAGHSATIADYSVHQSLVRTLKNNGLDRVYVTDWKSATEDMKDFTIDTYLEDLNAAVDHLGGVVHLIGLCQGGWLSAAYAARFPGKVKTLVLAGAPIDTDAGLGSLKELAHSMPMECYRDLVTAGNGRLLGKFMLSGWKNMHPGDEYIKKYADLFTHVDDPDYVKRTEEFSRWYESPLDLPGPYYLQSVEWLFKENRLAKGTFKGLGETLSLKNITVPIYLLAGASDDITPAAQALSAAHFVGTPRDQITKKIVPGGHIGLFMGRETLKTTWPEICAWIVQHKDA